MVSLCLVVRYRNGLFLNQKTTLIGRLQQGETKFTLGG
jgi:hypothetical protein